MQTLKLSEQNARAMYPAATAEIKKILEDSFGKDFFNQKIIDRVNNFDDVLRISGKKIEDLISKNDTPDEIAYKKIKLIAEVYNEGTVLDPMNTNQYKYYPWHEITPGSGFGLSFSGYDYWDSHPVVGVRLCFKSSALAIDAGKKFLDIYADLKIK